MNIVKVENKNKDIENVEIYVTSSDTYGSNDNIRKTLNGVSGFEISTIELSNVLYNLPFSEYIETDLGTFNIPAGSYTSTKFAEKLQETINLTAASPFTVVYDEKTGKITISNDLDFTMLNTGTWGSYFRFLLGYRLSPLPPYTIGPQKSYTFEFKSNDTSSPQLYVTMKALTSNLATPGIVIGAPFFTQFVETIPIDNQYGRQNTYFRIKNKSVKFKYKLVVDELDIVIRDMLSGNHVDIPWSMTLVFYF